MDYNAGVACTSAAAFGSGLDYNAGMASAPTAPATGSDRLEIYSWNPFNLIANEKLYVPCRGRPTLSAGPLGVLGVPSLALSIIIPKVGFAKKKTPQARRLQLVLQA